MKVEAGTAAMVLFDEYKVTVMPSTGAFAGLLLESCSWTTNALYDIPSEGTTDGKPNNASFEGTGPTVVKLVWTVS